MCQVCERGPDHALTNTFHVKVLVRALHDVARILPGLCRSLTNTFHVKVLVRALYDSAHVPPG